MTPEHGAIIFTILLVCAMVLVASILQISEFYGDTTLTCTSDSLDSNKMVCLKEERDISNSKSTLIELVLGIFAGAAISILLYDREVKKKTVRGHTFTLALLDYLIPLRKSTNELIEKMKSKDDENYILQDKNKDNYNNLKEYRLKINQLVLMSSDSIDTHHQLSLFKITNILEMKTPWDTHGALIILKQLVAEITDYLQKNKADVKKALELKNKPNLEKLRELKKPNLTEVEQMLKKMNEEQIKTNNEYVKDVLS